MTTLQPRAQAGKLTRIIAFSITLILAGLGSFFVYKHLTNNAPDEVVVLNPPPQRGGGGAGAPGGPAAPRLPGTVRRTRGVWSLTGNYLQLAATPIPAPPSGTAPPAQNLGFRYSFTLAPPPGPLRQDFRTMERLRTLVSDQLAGTPVTQISLTNDEAAALKPLTNLTAMVTEDARTDLQAKFATFAATAGDKSPNDPALNDAERTMLTALNTTGKSVYDAQQPALQKQIDGAKTILGDVRWQTLSTAVNAPSTRPAGAPTARAAARAAGKARTATRPAAAKTPGAIGNVGNAMRSMLGTPATRPVQPAAPPAP